MRRQSFDESSNNPSPAPIGPRTDWHCEAHGCPNAASLCEDPVKDRGRCYYHFIQPDRSKWDAITTEIRSDFDRMRNHGHFSPERQAEHRAQSREWARRQSASVVKTDGQGAMPQPLAFSLPRAA